MQPRPPNEAGSPPTGPARAVIHILAAMTMNPDEGEHHAESMKIQSHHLERAAYLYVRQSSMRQVIENGESTKRQYALRARAIALGWEDDQMIVIDSDQGESGASAVGARAFSAWSRCGHGSGGDRHGSRGFPAG